MKFQKTVNFLNTTSDNKNLARFVTKKWVEAYDQSQGNYDVNKEIRIKTSILRSDLCDFNDEYIIAKGDITVGAPNNEKKIKKIKQQHLKTMYQLSTAFQKLMA